MIKPWFNYPPQLQSFVVDLILAELATLRQGLQTPVFSSSKIALDESGLQADSLEMMALSTALSRSIHLENSEIDDNLFNKSLLDDWIAISLKSLSRSSAHISFKSSGSVGLKKYHTHLLAQLEQEAEFLGQLLKGRKRIVKAVPSHHIYGFIFTILLPRYLGDSVEVIDVRGLSFNAIQTLLQPGDLMIAYPEFWQFCDNSNINFASDIVGVNSSGPCPAQIGVNLLHKNLSCFYEIYGASETAGIGWKNHPSSAYTLFPFWQTTESQTDINRKLVNSHFKIYPLQDNVEWISPTQFMLKGRIDEMVQVGGINVSLALVREKLIIHPLIKEVAVRMMQPEEGARLKAFIVLKDDVESGSEPNDLTVQHIYADIERYISKNFSTAERPKSITYGHNLPVNKMGKSCDWPIKSFN